MRGNSHVQFLGGGVRSDAVLLPDQTLETKARFIAQVMKGDQGIRSLEDVELAALSYAEVKALASGNPMVIEKAGIDAEVAKFSTLFSVWRNQRYANESEICHLPAAIEALERRIDLYAKDCNRIEPQSMQSIELEISGRRVIGGDAVGDALRPIVRAAKDDIRMTSRAIERIIGRFAGFDLGVYASRGVESPNLYLSGDCLYHAAPYQTGPGLVASLLALLESIPKNHAESLALLELKRKRQEDIKRELDRPFEYESKLVELLARQRELMKLLDLDKDEVGSASIDAEEIKQAA